MQAKAREAEEQGRKQLEQGWMSLQDWMRTMLGGEDALKRIPDVKVLMQVRSEDAQKLVEETYEAVLQVLEEKGKKAKKLSEDVKEDEGGPA